MARALRRILRFRQLAEEQARLEVERAVQSLQQASAACERQIAMEHRQRSALAESWRLEARGSVEDRAADAENPAQSFEELLGENVWLMEEASLEFFALQRVHLEQIRDSESRRIEPIVERYKEHRRDLRQIEQVLAQQNAIENIERDRRTQAEIDEWFLQRRLLNRRRAQRNDARKPRTPEEKTSANF